MNTRVVREEEPYPPKEINIPEIIRAAYAADVERVRQLLLEGADVNSVDPRDNLSILHIAGMQADLKLAELILEHDAAHHDVDFTIESIFRPRVAWQYAANSNSWDIAELVHRAGLIKEGRKLLYPGHYFPDRYKPG